MSFYLLSEPVMWPQVSKDDAEKKCLGSGGSILFELIFLRLTMTVLGLQCLGSLG